MKAAPPPLEILNLRFWILDGKARKPKSFKTSILRIIGGLSLSVAGAITPFSAQAQLIPDNTLGPESSVVTPLNLLQDRIDGGAIAGANLFHSFLEFNVGNGRGVYFANPTGIENILTRVTGGNVSNILGTLGVLGNANLFLINPNGIFFGPNARLDVSGSFLATTGDRIQLGSQGYFSATDTAGSQLLAVQPDALFANALRNYQAEINNQGNLAVAAGQSLTLFGGTVRSSGSLTASGGTVRLLGDRVTLLNPATIDVSSPTVGGTVLVGGDYQGKGSIPTARQTFVGSGVTINADTLNSGDGGRVIVWSDETTQFQGNISARGGANSGNGGFVEVSGLKSLDFRGSVDALAPNGNPGTLLLDPTDFIVNAGNVGAINNAGANVTLQADNNITFEAAIAMANAGVGLTALAGNDITVNRSISTTGGDVEFNAGQNITLNDTINTFPVGGGTGGNVTLNAGAAIDFNSGSRVVTGFPDVNTPIAGRAGNIAIVARDRVSLTGSEAIARSFNDDSTTDNFTTVEIRASEGSVAIDNSTVSATNRGAGFAGDVSLSARDTVSILNNSLVASNGRSGRILIGTFPQIFPNSISPQKVEIDGESSLFTSNAASQADPSTAVSAGGILINASDSISISGGSFLETSTRRRGDAGRIFLETQGDVALSNSFVSSDVNSDGQGDGGIVSIEASSLFLSGSEVSAGTSGRGNALGIVLKIDGPIILSEGSTIRSPVEPGGVGNGGDIIVDTRSLTLTGGSQILTGVFRPIDDLPGGQGNAGNILIDAADFINISGVGNVRSGLFASTERGGTGDGGFIVVDTGTFRLTNGGIVNARTENASDAGNIIFNVDDILLVDNFGLISASGLGRGNPGNIVIGARGIVVSRNGAISAVSASGSNANIFLNTGVALVLLRGGDITTEAGNNGAGGNIRIISGAGVLTNLREDSNVLANAFAGQGGNISIRGLGALLVRLFNRNARVDTPLSDITASSSLGIDGSVSIDESLQNLPQVPLDRLNVEDFNQDVCALRDGKIAGGSSFIVTGPGGLPQNPTDTLAPLDPTVEWSSVEGSDRQSNVILRERPEEEAGENGQLREIRQAQGWIIEPDGTVILTADARPVASSSGFSYPYCHAVREE